MNITKMLKQKLISICIIVSVLIYIIFLNYVKVY